MLKWTVGFNPQKECPIILIWISLPELKLEFSNQKTLFSIANIFDKPLKLDKCYG
ncbi:hypothetical protein KSP39_PZI000465 [Platanthera zijinensis]|uniref:DUF4283 domain-containing protein n=1 Tax=Platanthera zijinensis TaxID=2320716 RepID=A0AAP0C5K5_9ASPA